MQGRNSGKMGRTFNYRPGTFNYRPGTFNYRPGTLNYKPGTFNYRPGTFNYRPGDPRSISSSCVTLRFVPRQIWIAMLMKGGSPIEYQLYGANCGPSSKQAIGSVLSLI